MKKTATLCSFLTGCLALAGLLLPIHASVAQQVATPEIPLAEAARQGPLPLELVRLEAHRQATGSVEILWQTAQERDSDFFEVQASTDGRKFQVLGQYKALGTSTTGRSYHHTEVNAFRLGAIRYYRLRQVDKDGSISLSSIVAVQGSRQKMALRAYPVPTQQQLTVKCQPMRPGATLIIVDGLGRECLRQPLNSLPGEIVETIVPVGNLAKGAYLVRLQQATFTEQLRFTKE